MRILILCPYPEGVAAGQRMKYEQYFDDWRAAGHVVTVAPFMDTAMWRVLYDPGHFATKLWGTLKGFARRLRDLATLGRYDLVFVHMWVTPFGATWPERWARGRTKRLIYDVEDNIVTPATAPTGSGGAAHPNPIARLFSRAHKARYLIVNADVVTVASPYLLPPYRELNRHHRAECISPSLDTDRFLPAPDAVRRARSGPPVIGWTGTFSSVVYLDLLRDVFVELARRVSFRLRVIGNFDYTLSGVDVEVVRWTAEHEVADLQALDIGVYPLIDDDWSRGKAGLKIIQYQAVGLPCVASDVPLSRQQIRDGVTGFLVDTPAQWVERLEQLVRDRELRASMGRAARADAARYSRQATASRYRAILDELR